MTYLERGRLIPIEQAMPSLDNQKARIIESLGLRLQALRGELLKERKKNNELMKQIMGKNK